MAALQRFLFGPGPSQIEDSVYAALSRPMVGYLDPYAFEVYDRVRAGLRQVFGTVNGVTLALSGTGSAGMEAAVTNFVNPGEKLAVFVAGFFGERLVEMGRRHGAQVVRADKPWGETFIEAEAAEFLDREKPAVVAFVHAETSTGALQDPLAITRPAREHGALVIADCVTSLGGVPVHVDASGIDIAYSCSQKGLSCPPGLAPFTCSERAWAKTTDRKNAVWYLDLRLLMDYFDGRKYHHTAPLSLFYAMEEGLRKIAEEGLETRFERHRRNHERLVAGLEAKGLAMHVERGKRIWTLNTVRVPAGIDDAAVRRRLLEADGIEIAGGFGPLAGKIFRIGLMGPLSTEPCVDQFLAAFARALS